LPVPGKARAGKLGSALEIEYAKPLANFPMRLGREIKVRRRAPAADLDIMFGSLANGHAVVWDVGNSGKHLVQADLVFCRGFFFLLNLLAELLGFGYLLGGVLATLLQFRNFLGSPVAACL